MKAKHTPGPWTLSSVRENEADVFIASIYDADNNWLADVWCDQKDCGDSNARLMVASPALLAACQRQVENIDRWLATGEPAGAVESESIYDQMVAAIALATGDRG